MPNKLSLIIDGKQYLGPKIDEGFALVKYLVPADSNKMLGFSDEKELLKWAEGKGERKIYEDCLKGALKAKEEHAKLSEKQVEDYENKLGVEMKALEVKFRAVLRKEGVAVNDSAKILKLAKENKIGTCYLYQHSNFRGRRLAVSNFKWIPKLSKYSFNDILSSVINASPLAVALWQNSYFWGLVLIVPPWLAFSSVGWFNDRASSVSW